MIKLKKQEATDETRLSRKTKHSLSAVLACIKDLTQARHSPEMTEAEKLAEKCCFLGVEN